MAEFGPAVNGTERRMEAVLYELRALRTALESFLVNAPGPQPARAPQAQPEPEAEPEGGTAREVFLEEPLPPPSGRNKQRKRKRG